MDIYMSTKEIQESVLASVTYGSVIDGLNGYFASEPRNSYITVRATFDNPDFILHDPEAWADILISWLRTKHNIFYYPGMEVCPLTEHMTELKLQNKLLKDEIRTLNAELATKWTKTSLINWLQQRARHKNVELDDSILYSDDAWYDWTDIIDFLFDEIVKMRGEIENATYCLETDTVRDGAELAAQAVETVCKDIMSYIRQESSRYGFELPKEIDDTPLTVESIFHDLLEALKKAKMEKEKFLIEVANRDEEIESLQKKGYDLYLKHRRYIMNNIRQEASRNGFDLPEKVDGAPLSIERAFRDLLELLKKRTAEIKEVNDKLLETEDLLHKSVDSVNAECKAVGKQMVADYEKDLLQFIYKEYTRRTQLSDKTISYNPPSVRNTITKIISDHARSRTRTDILETRIKSIFDRYKAKFTCITNDPTIFTMLDCLSAWFRNGESRDKIEKYQLELKDYIMQGIKKRGYPCDGLQTKSIGEIVDWIITMATCDRSNIALRDIYTTVASPAERLRYNIDDCNGANVDHMKEYILIRFKGLRSDTERCLKKIAEFDGCQKELKTLEEQQEWLIKQNMELSCKVCAKDDEISRLKGLINAMNAEMKDM